MFGTYDPLGERESIAMKAYDGIQRVFSAFAGDSSRFPCEVIYINLPMGVEKFKYLLFLIINNLLILENDEKGAKRKGTGIHIKA